MIHFIGTYWYVPTLCYNTDMTLLLICLRALVSRTSLLSVPQLWAEGIVRPQISRLVATGRLKRVARAVCATRLPGR